MRNWLWIIAAAGVAACGAGIVMTGCETSSADSTVRNVGLIVEGFYVGQGGGPIVSRTSGAPMNNMSLRQTGDQLEGIDNNGIVFRGSIGQVIDAALASFILEGRATSGQKATISGKFNVDGGTSVMSGSWIEPSLVSTVFATAVVPTNAVPDTGGGNGDETNVAVSPTTANLEVGESQTFTASGGSGNFSWSLSSLTLANIVVSGSRNQTATITAQAVGTLTITISDADTTTANATASMTIVTATAQNDDNMDMADNGEIVLPPPPPV